MEDGVRIGNPPAPAPAPPEGRLQGLRRWWPLLAAAGVMLALLLTLATVLRHSVEQAQARHAGTAARADANFRCSTMAKDSERSDCRARAAGQRGDTASSLP